MYYSLHTTETAEHHTGDVKYGRTQKRQTWDDTIVGRKSNDNKKKVIALIRRLGKNRENSEVRGKSVEINISMVVI